MQKAACVASPGDEFRHTVGTVCPNDSRCRSGEATRQGTGNFEELSLSLFQSLLLSQHTLPNDLVFAVVTRPINQAIKIFAVSWRFFHLGLLTRDKAVGFLDRCQPTDIAILQSSLSKIRKVQHRPKIQAQEGIFPVLLEWVAEVAGVFPVGGVDEGTWTG
eukprot:753222-Rhodomonas_salina.2